MEYLNFKSVIKMQGVNPYVLITKRQAAAIRPGWKKPLPVLIQINGAPEVPWHINMMPSGSGSFYLYLHGKVRKVSGTKIGDKVTISIKFDSEYKNGPQHSMPKWFSDALNKNPKAKTNWEMLIPSRKKEILRYFSLLKSQDAETRNMGRAIRVLSGKKERFMGRLWQDSK